MDNKKKSTTTTNVDAKNANRTEFADDFNNCNTTNNTNNKNNKHSK